MLVSQQQALALLTRGDIVAVPTETVYGLAGRIDSDSALKSIFSTKARPFFDPLIVHVAGVEVARTLTSFWPGIFDVLADAFWPGPLTLIAPKAAHVSPLITSGLMTVAVRCPNHPLALALLRALPAPFAAPSANHFGRTSPTSAKHVEDEFAGQVPVLDGGPAPIGVESTVLSAELESGIWRIKIHRPGAITGADISAVLKSTPHTIVREASLAAPGQLKAHYQPESPVVIVEGTAWNDEMLRTVAQILGRELTSATELKLPARSEEAARLLYEELRRLSRTSTDLIYVRRDSTHQGEYWAAVWDRLERASSTVIRG